MTIPADRDQFGRLDPGAEEPHYGCVDCDCDLADPDQLRCAACEIEELSFRIGGCHKLIETEKHRRRETIRELEDLHARAVAGMSYANMMIRLEDIIRHAKHEEEE